jgi:hypothetical protein
MNRYAKSVAAEGSKLGPEVKLEDENDFEDEYEVTVFKKAR